MTDVSKYLGILAKVMQSKRLSEINIDKEKYDKLYLTIYSELKPVLQNSTYPYASDIIMKIDKMMDSMESIYMCNELIEKKCVLITNYYTTKVFNECKSLFIDYGFVSMLSKIYTNIPLVIVNSNNESVIEVINYANARVMLSYDEFEFLINQSVKRKIALNKIIQFFVIKTRLIDTQLCIIADNMYGNADKMFWRSISHRLVYMDSKGLEKIKECSLEKFSALLVSDDVLHSETNNSKIKKYKMIPIKETTKYINKNSRVVLYGFWDEFISIETQIMDYYNKQICSAKIILQEVVSDIVRLENRNDKTLQSIRKTEENRENNLKSELKCIEEILKKIENIIVEICADLGENVITGKMILRYTINDIFEAFFRCEKFNNDLEKKILSRIYSYEYDNYELISSYVQMKNGKKINYDDIEINELEWEKAKMLIHILNPDSIPAQKLKLYVNTLGKHCNTAKELYAKAMVSSGWLKYELLHESLAKGYKKAGNMLLEMYKNGDKRVNMLSLANSLVPEACMIIADQKMNKYSKCNLNLKLSDSAFTYYKIAAAKQYLPAIGKIVDTVFELYFSFGSQNPTYHIEEGHMICQLCRVLIDKMYKVKHFREVWGIVLYCLNENLSGAMSLLENANSALAYYCKGRMYEFGLGVAVDLDQAIINYEKSLKKGMVSDVYTRLIECRGKLIRYSDESNSDEYYQSDKSYHSYKSYHSDESYQSDKSYHSKSIEIPMQPIDLDDGCFTPDTKILMSDGSYCVVENIKKGDCVIAFDHYTGKVVVESIIANVHDVSEERDFDIIEMVFEDGTKLKVVKSHVLFDMTDNRYVWINTENTDNYIGHLFASFSGRKILPKKLISYSIKNISTRYYVPISNFHMNVFAEGFLTMPPTKLSVNLFPIYDDMLYDLNILNEVSVTTYSEIEDLVTPEEYDALPCKYLSAILKFNNSSVRDFEYVMKLFREHMDN